MDQVAEKLDAAIVNRRGGDSKIDPHKLHEVAKENGFEDRLFKWEESGHNHGLIRMNTSNILRGKLSREGRVKIGRKVVRKQD